MAVQAKFEEAISAVFGRWTTLQLAMEQGWGGRESRQKGKQLQAELLDYLANASRKKRPPSHENSGDVDDLAHLLYQRIDELFNTETDDGSVMEVAGLCLRLLTTCQAGDTSFAEQVLQACQAAPAVDLSKCQGQEKIEYATEEDELLDQMDGMDLDEDGSEDEGDGDGMAEEAPANAAAPPAAATLLFGAGMSGLPGGNSAGYASPEAAPAKPKQQLPEPEVDEDGFTSIVKGRRRPR
eukprot:TRINITY_DN95640_c0_g1_i1.p1 TRINITY_DN95640_c0_g1~~TRINITY_DN95640_c0_g1_i1.p1  ORF type:complete len:239 (-),score=77.98 TRINITY_DN95640_c0_g1_i1:171-887(-)